MIDGHFVFKKTEPANVQKLGDGAVILMVDSGQLYSGNETAESFLTRIDGLRPLKEIVDLMHAEFDVERAELESDVLALVKELQEEGILERVAPAA